MRTLKISFLILLTMSVFAACKKDNEDIEKPTIVGFWKGKYGIGTNNPALPYGQLFRSDGTTRIYLSEDTTADNKGEGTYVVINGTVNTDYLFAGATRISSTAILDSALTLQIGTFGYGSNTTNAGRFYMEKQ